MLLPQPSEAWDYTSKPLLETLKGQLSYFPKGENLLLLWGMG